MNPGKAVSCRALRHYPVFPFVALHTWTFTGRTDAKGEAPILWPVTRRTDSLEKTLRLGKIEGRRWRGQQSCLASPWLDGITDSMDLSLSKLQETVKHREVCHAIVRGAAKESDMTEQHNWTELKKIQLCIWQLHFNWKKEKVLTWKARFIATRNKY